MLTCISFVIYRYRRLIEALEDAQIEGDIHEVESKSCCVLWCHLIFYFSIFRCHLCFYFLCFYVVQQSLFDSTSLLRARHERSQQICKIPAHSHNLFFSDHLFVQIVFTQWAIPFLTSAKTWGEVARSAFDFLQQHQAEAVGRGHQLADDLKAVVQIAASNLDLE